MKKLLPVTFATLFLSACSVTDNNNDISSDNNNAKSSLNSPKNIIMIVGDGMGPAYTTAYRYFNDNPQTTIIEETVFDRHLVGLSSTYPAQISGYVTDSAAAATALSTGVKSYNGAIGLDVNKSPVETVLERAKKQGMRTGVVVTSQVNHATPASYLTHNESRKNYNAIADSYIDNGIKADVILGGGWQYFIRDDRNLVNEFKSAGFHYVDEYDALNTLPQNKTVLGLFADVGLPWALDDSNPHRLSVMTKAATKQLENDNGYFLLVEASQIDWAGHSNDISAAMAEMTDLAIMMEYLEKYVQSNPDTLVILTADHSTGGFTVAANGKYEWNPEVLHTMKRSPHKIAKELAKTDITIKEASDLLNFAITQEEAILLQQAKYHATEKLVKYLALDDKAQKKQTKPNIETTIYIAIKKLIDKRTNSGWTSSGHTAIDVPVFALGKGKELFEGKIDNTDIAKKIFILLGNK